MAKPKRRKPARRRTTTQKGGRAGGGTRRSVFFRFKDWFTKWISEPGNAIMSGLAVLITIGLGTSQILAALHASVSVTPQEQTDPTGTAHQPFLITNNGAVPVYDLAMTCTVNEAVNVKNEYFKDIGDPNAYNPAAKKLEPKRKLVGWCGSHDDFFTAYPYVSVDITVIASYRAKYHLWGESEKFRFYGVRTSRKEQLRWLPVDPVEFNEFHKIFGEPILEPNKPGTSQNANSTHFGE